MRRVADVDERYISESMRVNCDLARRYVGLNLSQQILFGGVPSFDAFVCAIRYYNVFPC